MNSSKSSGGSGLEEFIGGIIAIALTAWFLIARVLIPLFYLGAELIKLIGVLMVKFFHFLISILPYLHGLLSLFLYFAWSWSKDEIARLSRSEAAFSQRLAESDEKATEFEASIESISAAAEAREKKVLSALSFLKRETDRLVSIPEIRQALETLKLQEAAKLAVDATVTEGKG